MAKVASRMKMLIGMGYDQREWDGIQRCNTWGYHGFDVLCSLSSMYSYAKNFISTKNYRKYIRASYSSGNQYGKRSLWYFGSVSRTY
jgi:hypothetical protein